MEGSGLVSAMFILLNDCFVQEGVVWWLEIREKGRSFWDVLNFPWRDKRVREGKSHAEKKIALRKGRKRFCGDSEQSRKVSPKKGSTE